MKLVKFFKETFKLPTLLGVTAEAEDQRNQLALAATGIKSVINANDHQAAGAVLANIQAYIKGVRDAGLSFRRPMNDFTSLVKSTEDQHLAPLLNEKERIGRLVADFAVQEARRVAEEERKRMAEFEAKERARQEELRKAEEARLKALESGKKKDLKAAEAQAAKAEAATEQVQTLIAAPMPEASKAAGISVRKVLKWEVTDIMALVKDRPDLCNITPKASAIQAVCIPEMPNKPAGLKLWWENKTVANSRFL